MNIADLREQRSRVMAELEAINSAGSFTAESRAAFDAKAAEIDTLDGDIKRLERIPTDSTRTSRPNPGANEDRTAQTKAALRSFMLGGTEHRDLLTINASGAAVIPQAFYPSLIEAQKAYGGIVNIVNQFKSDNGEPMKISLVNDTANTLVSLTEGVDATEIDPPFTSVMSTVDQFTTGVVKVSVPELQDSNFDLDSWLRGAFGKRFYRGLSTNIINGDGANFAGLLSGYTANEITSAAVGKIGYADIVSLYGALDPAYINGDTAWVMNAATRAALMSVTDTLGRPLFDPSPNGPGFGQLLGIPVVVDQSMPSLATGHTAVALGDFKAGYLFRQVNPGLSIVRLNERFMTANEIGFVGFARLGGTVTDAGTHPIVLLKVQ